jgi:Holliday junction resolvasome RuvABC endonuclease subunit
VLGLDLSLAGTGCALPDRVWSHKTKGQRGDSYAERLTRLRAIRAWVVDQIDAAAPDLIVVEAPSYASQSTSTWDRAKLWWDVVDRVTEAAVPLAFAPPANVKKYATGSGNCAKSAMIAATYRRLPGLDVGNDNEADAAWLMAMGCAQLGAPLCELPVVQSRALVGVVWPAAILRPVAVTA